MSTVTYPPGGAAVVPHEPTWRVRWRLTRKALRESWAMFRENPVGLVGLGIIVFYAILGALHPVLMRTVWDEATYHPVTGLDRNIFTNPSPPSWITDEETIMLAPQPWWKHLLGTDPLGRDILSQLMYSTASEFGLGIGAALVTVLIATTTGAIAAYYGGIADTIIMRVADVLLMLPFIPILIVLSALFDFQLIHLAIVLGILSGLGGTNITIKAQALTLKVKAYVDAARVAGGSDWHIIFVHLVPNLLPLAFLYMMINVTNAIFSEAVLSFFGLLNIRISWGIMISTTQAAGYLLTGWEYWYLMFPAGLSISLLCSAFYLVGRALDEVINPRLRKR